MSQNAPPKEIIRFLRPQRWLHALGIVLLGYLSGGAFRSAQQIVIVVAAGSLFLAQGYGFNNIADAAVDRKEKNPLVSGSLKRNVAVVLCTLIASAGLVLSVYISPPTALCFLAGILINIAYSFYPLRLKRFFLSNIILNSAGFVALAFIGLFARPATPMDAVLFGGFIFLSLVPYQIVHIYSHKRDDPLAGLPENPLPSFIASHAILLGWSALIAYSRGWNGLLIATAAHAVSHSLPAWRMRGKNALRQMGWIRKELRYISIGWGFLLLLVFYRGGVL